MIAAALARAEAIGARAAERRAAAIADAVAGEVSGVGVERVGGEVTITARGLARRAFADPALRWFGGVGR